VGCTQVDAITQAVLDALAEPGAAPCSTAAVAEHAGIDSGAVLGVFAELVSAGWVFGDPEGWELTGAGYSHTTRRRGGGILGDRRGG
jgi:DNA-binding IclR family transcriptional regulator